jgi:hypothetical protein
MKVSKVYLGTLGWDLMGFKKKLEKLVCVINFKGWRF